MPSNYVPQVDYTSRDYRAILSSLIENIQYFAPEWKSRDANDFGIILLELYAYMGDLMSYYIDRSANEAFLDTASQRDSVVRLAKMLNYVVGDATPAKTVLTFTNGTGSPIIVPAKTRISTTTVISGYSTQVEFETDEELEVPANDTATVSATQGYSIIDEVVSATGSNGSKNQVFALKETGVDVTSVVLTIDGVIYSRVANLIDYGYNDPVFSTFVDASGNTFIIFGDGIAGRIPPLYKPITASYRVIDGSLGNVPANTLININSNYEALVGITGVTNAADAAGGSDEEPTLSIRNNAPRGLRALNRAVTLDDYASIAVGVPGVGSATALSDIYTSINLYVKPELGGGVDNLGDPTAEFLLLADDVSATLSGKTSPNVTVTVLPPEYVEINVTATLNLYPNAKNADAETAALQYLTDYFDPSIASFGQVVSLFEVMQALTTAEGVLYPTISVLSTTVSGVGDIVLEPWQIPILGDVSITATGGL